MDCSQLDAYLADRLSPTDVRAFEAHAATCADCGKAVARKQAIERAQAVMRRNAQTRVFQVPATKRVTEEVVAMPASSLPPVQRAVTREAIDPGATTLEAEIVTPRRRGPVLAVAVVLAAVLAGVVWSKTKDSHEAGADPGTLADAPAPSPTEPPGPSVPAPQPEAPAPMPELEPVQQAAPVPPPSPAPAPPVPTAPKFDPAKADNLPNDTDIELLAEVVATRRCWPAIAPLRNQVARAPSNARAWGLLTQCYAKRKKWKSTLDAYANVTKYGDAELVASLKDTAENAKAALEAEAQAAAEAEAAADPAP